MIKNRGAGSSGTNTTGNISEDREKLRNRHRKKYNKGVIDVYIIYKAGEHYQMWRTGKNRQGKIGIETNFSKYFTL